MEKRMTGYNIVKDPVRNARFPGNSITSPRAQSRKLVFKHLGRRYRLTDVASRGKVVDNLIA